jgi:hypothetical protein
MKIIIILLLLLIPVQNKELIYKHGKPTTKGICEYIEDNADNFIDEFEKFVGDSIPFNITISTDNLSEYYERDSLELGEFNVPNLIIITNQTIFIDYELKCLSWWKKINISESNQFVKTTVMHELMHAYFYTVLLKTKQSKQVQLDYLNGLHIYPVNNNAVFVEEGICEYLVEKMNMMICDDNYNDKNYNNDSISKYFNTYYVKYHMSRLFVKPIVDRLGFKEAIKILVINKIPTINEILNPDIYYRKLRLCNDIFIF